MLNVKAALVLTVLEFTVNVCIALTNTTVSFDKDACHFSERAVSDQTTYHVTYDGSPIDHLLCSMMKFYGGDSSRINSYRVCVTLLFYKDPDCAIWFGYILTLSETAIFNCTVRPPSTYCSEDPSGAFKIQIKDNNKANSTANVKFRMNVFGELVTNYVLILSGSIGGSLGGIMLTYTFVKLFLYIRKKTKY
ncbi:uncharacterized protein LOC125656426 [Ostrea edulis]|uniref:uncharacterized protein LOC125656426 n=1 Tax=Ostrea edulis TaxID=37623 RepID=UPI002095EA4D|nr:uncharacterized protein LOC125656426 [Ostrea edulis]